MERGEPRIAALSIWEVSRKVGGGNGLRVEELRTIWSDGIRRRKRDCTIGHENLLRVEGVRLDKG